METCLSPFTKQFQASCMTPLADTNTNMASIFDAETCTIRWHALLPALEGGGGDGGGTYSVKSISHTSYRTHFQDSCRLLTHLARYIHTTTPSLDVLATASNTIVPNEVWKTVLCDFPKASSSELYALGCSYVERFLTEVHLYLCKVHDRMDVTHARDLRITDLLQQPLLISFFGAEFMFLWQCLLGPLFGLNFRNLIWHGFISSGEWEESYSSLLLVLMHSTPRHNAVFYPNVAQARKGLASFDLYALTRIIRTGSLSDVRARARDAADAARCDTNILTLPLSACPIDAEQFRNPMTFLGYKSAASASCTPSALAITEWRMYSHLGGPYLDSTKWIQEMGYNFLPDRDVVLTALHRAWSSGEVAQSLRDGTQDFIPPQFQFQFLNAFQCFVHGGKQQVLHCACSLLIIVEVALRRQFAKRNSLDVYATPNGEGLLTTIDTILDPLLEGGAPNLLVSGGALSDGAMAILFDHYIWKDGPRLRDDLAHAAVNPLTIPLDCVAPLLAVCVSLIGHSDAVRTWIDAYRPIVAPDVMFKKELAQCAAEFEAFEGLVRLVASRAIFPGQDPSSNADALAFNARPPEDPNFLPNVTEMEALVEGAAKKGRGLPFSRREGFTFSQVVKASSLPPPPVFKGRITMCISKFHTKIQILRRIVCFVCLFMAEIAEKYSVVYEKAMRRELYKKPRQMYARLVGDIPTLAVIVRMFVTGVEMVFEDSNSNEETLRCQMLKAIESLISAVGDHQWHRSTRDVAALMAMLRDKIAQ